MQLSYKTYVSIVTLCLSIFVASAQAAPLTGGTGPGGFDLTNGSTTLKSWLDASDASTRFTDAGVTPAGNGDPVYLWKDKSGNNNSATATNTTTQRPAYNSTALSGNSAIRFDPTGGVGVDADAMLISTGLNITGTTPYTVFIVDQYYGANQGRTMQSTSQNWLIGKWQGQNGFHVNGAWVSGPSGHTAGTNAPTIGAGTVTGVPGQSSYYINAINSTDSSAPTGGPGSFALGAAGVYPNEVSNSDISEIIVYTRALNIAERRIVENYLSSKYNVGTTTVGSGNRTLGANDLYSGDLDTNGHFDHEVIGVGRTDASNQQLNSGAGGFGIQVSGGVAPNELNDGEFILAGHNAGLNSIVDISADPSITGVRWSRIWNIDTNGGSADATLGFNFADAGLAPNFDPNATYQLLYSTDQSFSTFEALDLGFTIDGNDTISFNVPAELLLNGYFTLGINVGYVPEPSSLSLFACGIMCLAMRSSRRRRNVTNAA